MLILTVVLGVAALASAALCVMQDVQTRRISRRLKALNDEGRTQLAVMSLPAKSSERLVEEINRMIRAKAAQAQSFRAKEQKLRKAITDISHDMRTPLTAVLGYIQLIGQGKATAEEQAGYMRIIEARSRALYRLVQDFYDLSRLDEGEYQFDSAWIDVSEMCLESLAAAYDGFAALGMQVDVGLLPKAPKVFADRNAVDRVYENLLGNARKHGREVLRISSAMEGGAFAMRFENGSEPMKKGEIEQVFERSYTSNKSRANENTGMGLAICKALLDGMGHEIAAAYSGGYFSIKIIWQLHDAKTEGWGEF